ncbi:DoxX family membrane protein [Desertihabitans brevis]|uniref:DoxX family membrane protein n=1 Tax=Desertihabitans brevis TaxID=2268447 RepID=A0A367YYM2_9ACTN|nr:DoxX family membrane protein [Desertihabitans brevis]RCK71013.1 DoxX family membrane protein [Desertihabitans brevis]
MSLPRFAARAMLASLFVSRGLKAARQPDELVPVVEPLTDRLVPLVQKNAPSGVGSYIPSDTATLVRIGGVAQVLAALALATGRARRPGAVLLSISMVPQLLASAPFGGNKADDDGEQKRSFLTNLAVLGGVLLASLDTEGKPSLAWRAQAGGDKVAAKTRKARNRLAKEAKQARKDARRAVKKVEKKFD